MNVERETLDAEARIRAYIRETPVEDSPILSQDGCRVHLKLENYQLTGSFKVRGAFNKLLALDSGGRRDGVLAASSGNHGAAMAYAGQVLDCPATIVVPEDASPAKLGAIRARGADIVVHGNDCVQAEAWGRGEAARRGVPFVSPYNDPHVIAGQGTIGVELERQLQRPLGGIEGGGLQEIDTIYVAVGGGGMISGIAGYLKARHPRLEVVGCSPESSAVMCESLRAGRILDLESLPTLSDGTAGGVESGALTFELCGQNIDRFVLVSEREIAEAMRLVIEHHHMLVEGAAAVPVAAFLEERQRHCGKNVVLVLCGANVSADVLRRVLD